MRAAVDLQTPIDRSRVRMTMHRVDGRRPASTLEQSQSPDQPMEKRH
jgi:hypothetical protein